MKCVICGCTEDDACRDEELGETCAWAELAPGVFAFDRGSQAGDGLCTFCAADIGQFPERVQLEYAEVIRLGVSVLHAAPLVELVTDAQANAFLRARGAGA